jgi:hypothetical protein
MHPEIEKLIDLAAADGQITEKEKNVILKKAAELQVDVDEVEMTLDAKKHIYEKSTIGAQIKCPSCGTRISGLVKTCSCGYLFNTGSIHDSKSLESSIETLENLIIQVRGLSSSNSKEVIDSSIAKVEKEIRYIKTRYADNGEVKKLLAELEGLSARYINKLVNKRKKRTLILTILTLLGITVYVYLFIGSRLIESKREINISQKASFSAKLDSVSNPKLKQKIKSIESGYIEWEKFKERFFESYPDFGDGYVVFISTKYKLSEKAAYKVAENHFNIIKRKFQTPIDFILFDDRNNFRTLASTAKNDSSFILKLISVNRWKLKKEIDNKIELIQNLEIKPELISMNDIDSTKQAALAYWNDEIKSYILNENNGTYPKQGWVKSIIQFYRTDEETAKNYALERLRFFASKCHMPIDFFYYRDNSNYSYKYDKDDEKNRIFCEKKFKLKAK